MAFNDIEPFEATVRPSSAARILRRGGTIMSSCSRFAASSSGIDGVSIRYVVYCGPVLRHSAGLIQAANIRSVVVF